MTPPIPPPAVVSIAARLAPAMERPGTWIAVHTYKNRNTASTVAAQLKNGRLKTPPGEWSFRSQKVKGGGLLWVLYHGKSDV